MRNTSVGEVAAVARRYRFSIHRRKYCGESKDKMTWNRILTRYQSGNQKLILGIEIISETRMFLLFYALSKACEEPTDIILLFLPFLWPSVRLKQPDSRWTHFHGILCWGFN